MSYATTDDGVRLYYEETGRARRSSSCTSSPATTAAGSRRCGTSRGATAASTFNARGYPPSDVPPDVDALLAGRAPRRHHRGDGRAQDRQGARRRPVDGRLRDAALRPHASGAGAARWSSRAAATAPSPTSAQASAPRPRERGEAARAEGIAGRRRRATPTARRACSSRTRTRAASRSSARSSPSTRRSARRTPCSACRRERPSLYELDEPLRKLDGADARRHRRRGLALPRARADPQAHDPVGGAASCCRTAGHTINLEEPDLFNPRLDRFFAHGRGGAMAGAEARRRRLRAAVLGPGEELTGYAPTFPSATSAARAAADRRVESP